VGVGEGNEKLPERKSSAFQSELSLIDATKTVTWEKT